MMKDDRTGLRGPLPPVIHGVLSLAERQCRRQMIPGWPYGDLLGLFCECHVSWEELGGWSGHAVEESASSSRDMMPSRPWGQSRR